MILRARTITARSRRAAVFLKAIALMRGVRYTRLVVASDLAVSIFGRLP